MPLLLTLFGALVGGSLRYVTERGLQTRLRRPTRGGPFALNFLGCLLLGALSGWAYRQGAGGATTALGAAITLFSVCGYETARVFRTGRRGMALAEAVAGWFVGLMASAAGVFLVVK
ncbi:CrcB family protein [Streptomyces montanisoli]|uniref:Fluoride-specific ion channel n=1 Tax=Streptomyces montanisoli TaxID=2798581 RepID=A0A940RTI0_9ACTN|nr:CrcB family protein [Streptomyces montanisoli]MBP0456892.1 CrcB family protein [Streptomyces montanisoli]